MSWSGESDKVKKWLLLLQKIKANTGNNKGILCIFSLCENNKFIRQGFFRKISPVKFLLTITMEVIHSD